MSEKRTTARLYGPPLLVITFVLPFLAYYVSLTRRQAADFDYRAFRVLEAASTHLQREFDGVRSAMVAADRVANQVTKRGVAAECPKGDLECRHNWAPAGSGATGVAAEVRAYLKEYIKVASQITYHGEHDLPPAKPNVHLTLCCRDETNPPQFQAALSHDGDNHEHISVTIPPAALESRLLPGEASGFFDSVLATLVDGTVIFRSSKSPYQAVQLDALFARVLEEAPTGPEGATKPVAKATLESRAGASSRTEVEAFGDRFLIYVQPTPLRLGLRDAPKPGSEKNLVFVGITRKSRYDKASTAVPPGNLALLILGLLITAAITWPLLKLFTMSPKERLRRLSVISLFISTMAAFLLMALLYLEFGFLLWLYDRTDVRLEAIVRQMSKNVTQEVTNILASLDEHEQWLHDEGIEPNLETLEYFDRPPMEIAPSYPFFRHAIFALYRPDAVDSTGLVQHYKLSADRIPTPLIATPFSQFPAIGELHRGRGLRLSPPSRPFTLQTISSPNTGEFLTIFFSHPLKQPRDVQRPPAGTHQVMMLTTPLLSLKDAVLPMGFGYAVLDAQGLVQFHTDSSLNLRENFLNECERPDQLASLMQMRASTHVDLRYRGRDRRAFVAPLSQAIPGLPWTVVVYRDAGYVRAIALQSGLLFVVGMVTAAAVATLFWILLQLFRMIRPASVFRHSYRRIWPIERRKPQYLRRAVCLLAGLAVLLFATLPWGLAGSPGRLLVGLGVAAAALLLTSWRPARAWLDIRLRPVANHLSLALVFTLFWASFLMLTILSGALLLFQASLTAVQHQNEVASHRYLLDQLHQRKRAAEAEERSRGLSNGAYSELRHGSRLDIYDPRAYGDSWSNFVERQLVSYFDEPLRVLNRAVLPAAGDSTGLALVSVAGEFGAMAEDWRAARIQPQQGKPLLPWPVVPWRDQGGYFLSYLALGLIVFFALFIWLYSVLRRFFAQEFEDPDPLVTRTWETLENPTGRLLVLCHPRSGLSGLARQRFPGQIIDIPLEFNVDAAALPQRRERLLARYTNANQVVIDNLEWQFGSRAGRMETLRLLEGLVYANRTKVLIFTSVDPVTYLEAMFGEGPSAELREELDRWIRVMGSFEQAMFDAQDSLQPEWLALRPLLESWQVPVSELHECRRIFWREFSATIHLHQQAKLLVERFRHSTTRCRSAHDFERLMVTHAREIADDYYRMVWITMSSNERLALYQLAIDGWVNPLNKAAVCHLIRKRIIRNGHGTRAYEMLNESFRQFVLEAQDPNEVQRWREEEQSSTWRSVRLSLVTVLVLVALWLLYVRQDLFDRMFSYAGALAGGSAALLRVSWVAIQQMLQKPKNEAK